MTTTKEDLWNTLEELTEQHFKTFKWFLKDIDAEKGYSAISTAQLEGADRHDTVDLMVNKYGCSGAREKTIKILEKMKKNDLVQRLKEGTNRQNHDAVPLKYEYERKKAKLRETMAEIKVMIKERQMKIWEIKHSAECSKKHAERQIADSVRAFSEFQRSVESSLANLIEEIEEEQKKMQKQAERFVRELEQEISELNKRSTEAEQLSLSDNHLDLLQSFRSATKNWTDVSVPQPSHVGSATTAVNQLKEKLSTDMERFLTQAELKSVQQFAVDVMLDPETAHPHLVLSNDGKRVHCGDVGQNPPDNPQRFNSAANVLGKQSFSSGRFYFQVQVKGKTAWDLGVVKESINRKGSIKGSSKTGFWTMCLRRGDMYEASGVRLTVKNQPQKVGVFVDYEKRSVSFYDVDSAELIHRFTDCSFTEKLYPFFSPSVPHGGQNSTPLVIFPVTD